MHRGYDQSRGMAVQEMRWCHCKEMGYVAVSAVLPLLQRQVTVCPQRQLTVCPQRQVTVCPQWQGTVCLRWQATVSLQCCLPSQKHGSSKWLHAPRVPVDSGGLEHQTASPVSGMRRTTPTVCPSAPRTVSGGV